MFKTNRISALGSNDDVPETTFTDFHVSDHLKSFDSETDYIGLMIADVKYENKWYHDGRKHHDLTYIKPNNKRRQKRYARKTQNTWGKWTRQDQTTTMATGTTESMRGWLQNWESRNWVSPQAVQLPSYRTTPRPVTLRTYPARLTTERPFLSRRPGRRPYERSTRSPYMQPTNVISTMKAIATVRSTTHPYPRPVSINTFPARPITESPFLNRRPGRRPYERSTRAPYKYPTTVKASATTRSTTSVSTTNPPTTASSSAAPSKILTKRIKPGTILMINSTYLQEKYISTKLATTFHRALLMDYFELSESEMKEIGMTVVAWGFSYQVKDNRNSEKFYCDFKFRSGTFNAGYVGADIDMGIVKFDG